MFNILYIFKHIFITSSLFGSKRLCTNAIMNAMRYRLRVRTTVSENLCKGAEWEIHRGKYSLQVGNAKIQYCK